MGILDDIEVEKNKLIGSSVGTNMLGKLISNKILVPILEKLEEDIPDIMQSAAEWAKDQIISRLQSTTPSGRSYKIYHYDPSAPKGGKLTLIDEYTASAPGQLPAQLTGTLVDAVDYRIASDGSFRIGVLKDFGMFSDGGTEFESVFYRNGKIFVNPDLEKSSKTPVGTYSQYLADGTDHMTERPWFREIMNEIQDELFFRIENAVKNSLNNITKGIIIRRAIVFKVYFK